jgi:hypothetical protein
MKKEFFFFEIRDKEEGGLRDKKIPALIAGIKMLIKLLLIS